MGEYIHVKSLGDIKLGTMDDWRYVRREEAEKWLQAGMLETREGAKGEVEAVKLALKEPSILWRFPFPWEDDQPPERYHDRSMEDTVIVEAPQAIQPHQRQLCVEGIASASGGYNVNYFVPCPYTLKPKPRKATQKEERDTFYEIPESDPRAAWLCSALPPPALEVCGDRYDEKYGGRTIFRCIYCKCLQSFELEGIVAIRNANRERLGEEFVMRLKVRLTP